MEMREVVSSNVKRIGYEESTKMLYVDYNSGTYAYLNAEKPLYEELTKTESIGKFLTANVKGKFEYIKL